ncbi:Na/Pi symporter [Rhodoferax sp.]|uniref:Na/Pi cotransporter family protein n=1 Tax=Rhodoferax sp. TaxID=50421 RepID=UPI0019EB43CA|nr:Na/Pi symporter [Rhodoferax sp.]MBE0474006.1 Na/Pi cotransporter family protein [Rhodoferax sp.]
MNNLGLVGGLVGGVGLFLLGMGLMTDGLKLAAGPALERILMNATQTRLRGLASGMAVTAVVQSSSAITVATIGFVNAGLLNLSQAVWVLFGANVGTTMTGWLVALVGLKFQIDALALPLIGIGMVMRLSGEGQRRGAIGMALAGFGVLFLGIDMLKVTFSVLSTDFHLPEGQGALDTLMQVGIGIFLTVVMQSSSAALTVALTAAQGGLLSAQGAAAVVIGANIGTTVTALIAAIGATPNAKRAAAAHILFNLLTGTVALLLLPWLIDFLAVLRGWLGLEAAPAAKLALFHTVFNLLGVALIWPLASRMTAYLETRFKAADADVARPLYLDKNVLTVPALAIDALQREVQRMGQMAVAVVQTAFTLPDSAMLATQSSGVTRLNQAIADFIVQLNRAGMSPNSAARLTATLRLARDHDSAAELAREGAQAWLEAGALTEPLSSEQAAFKQSALALLNLCSLEAPPALTALDDAAAKFLADYEALKNQLLVAGAVGGVPVTRMDAQLRAARALRRAAEHVEKATRLLISQAAKPHD